MSRKIIKKNDFPSQDIKYDSFIISLLINKLLKNGKKSISQKIVYNCLNMIEVQIKKNPILVLEQSIRNIAPLIKLIPVYIENNNFFLPTPIDEIQSIKVAITWLVKASLKRNGNKMYLKLVNEIIDAYKGTGNCIKKKELLYKKAEASRIVLKA